MFNAWVRSSPLTSDGGKGGSSLHKNSVVSEVSEDEQLYSEAGKFHVSDIVRVCVTAVLCIVIWFAFCYAASVRGRAQSTASEGGTGIFDGYSPRRSMRHSFTLSEEEALQLTRRGEGSLGFVLLMHVNVLIC